MCAHRYQQGFSVRSAYEYALESAVAGHALEPAESDGEDHGDSDDEDSDDDSDDDDSGYRADSEKP